MGGKTTVPALGHIGPEVRSFYSVDDKTCLLAGAEQEGPAHNPWSTHPPHPVVALDTNHVELAGTREPHGWFLETHGCALKEWARSALLYMQTQWATYCPGSAKHPFAGGPNCSMKRGASFPSA